MKILGKNEINKIIEKASSEKSRTFMIINVLVKTGVRVSELLSITVNDILMEEKQIIIRGKGDKIRNIDVPSELLYMIRIYIKNKHLKGRKRLFPLTRDAVYKICKNVANINPHAFRHSYAVELLRKTKNVRYVQTQLGHKTLDTTQVYLRYMDFSEDKKKLVELYK